jgi:hypothetical protein
MMSMPFDAAVKASSSISSRTETQFEQLFEYQHLLLLRDTGGQSSYLYVNVVHFFKYSVN